MTVANDDVVQAFDRSLLDIRSSYRTMEKMLDEATQEDSLHDVFPELLQILEGIFEALTQVQDQYIVTAVYKKPVRRLKADNQ